MFEASMAFTRSGDGHAGGLQQGQVRRDVKLRHLAALHEHRAHSRDAIQRRLQIVGGDLPEPRLRHGVGGEAVAEDRERWRR